jgi:NDP-sugar pyrophosphorylase family protein
LTDLVFKSFSLPKLSKENTRFGFSGEALKTTFRNSNITLYRIVALADFRDVKKGDIGGFIQEELNIDFNSKAWVYNNAKVFGYTEITDKAKIFDNAEVLNGGWHGDYENGEVTRVGGTAQISGNSKVCDECDISGNVRISDNANLSFTSVSEGVDISGNVQLYKSDIKGDSKIKGNTRLNGVEVTYGLIDLDYEFTTTEQINAYLKLKAEMLRHLDSLAKTKILRK